MEQVPSWSRVPKLNIQNPSGPDGGVPRDQTVQHWCVCGVCVCACVCAVRACLCTCVVCEGEGEGRRVARRVHAYRLATPRSRQLRLARSREGTRPKTNPP